MSRTNPAWGTQEHVRQLERDAFDCCERVIKNWLIVRIIFKTILWIPPLIIFGMFCYANFVFSVLFCFNQLSSLAGYTLLAAFLFITFNIVWGLACTSLIRATISDPGRVPDEYNERMKHEDAVAPISPDNNSHHQISQPTICRRCNVARPPRAHHCRHCGYCVRKMDHHCPVINNCVGWGNYKYFVLLLTWAAVMCLMGCVAAVVKFALIDWQGFTGTEIQLFIGIAVAVIYSFLLIPFAGVHYHMIFNNQTTLESVIPISAYANSHIFDVGKKNNFEQIFGTDKTLWFLPVFTTQGDGCSFPIRTQEINNQMRQNQQALEQYV